MIPGIVADQPVGRRIRQLVAGAGLFAEPAAEAIPVVFTEQYPKGLGPTLADLRQLAPGAPCLAKSSFSCLDEPVVADHVDALWLGGRRTTGIRQEIVAVTHGLDVEEHAVEHERHGADEAQLDRRVERPGRAGGVGWQDERQGRKRHQHDEIGVGARQAKTLLAIAQAAHDQAEPDHAVAYHHDHREHRLARQRRPTLARQHDRQDQRHFDHGDGHGQHQRAVGLSRAMGNDIGVMD